MKRVSKRMLMMLVLSLVLSVCWTAAPKRTEAASANGQDIVDYAMQYVGKVPYVWGGTSLTTGADCSGFICRIYEHFGFNLWPHRTKLRNAGTNIGTDFNQAKPGDIIWFEGHVGIYAGTKNGYYMMVNEIGGNVQNVSYMKVKDCTAKVRGIIQIPGVNGTAATPTVQFFAATDPTYAGKQGVWDTNAVLVSQITKTSGLTCTKMGIQLCDGNYNLIKDYSENVSNVSAAQTIFHSWFDVNAELKVTLTKATTYLYRFYGVFSGNTYYGDYRSFTTTGTVATYTVHYDANRGTGAPADQVKLQGAALTLTDIVPTRKAGTITFDPNGGVVDRTTQSDEYIFARWSTSDIWGVGDSYYPGGSYTLDQNITLYAQWNLRGIGELPVATRDGYVFKGWQIKGGTGSYILPGMVVTEDFVAIAAWIRQGWVYENQSWYYYDTAGKITTGWSVVDGVWYYFDENGIMQTGWQLIDGDWYYLNASGAMQVGWMNQNGNWYYLYGNGKIATGWVLIGNDWYYFNGNGNMITGWAMIGDSWYYLNASGAMQIGWLHLNGTWYYLTSGGSMATGWALVGNTWYYFNASGAMQTGWLQLGNTWYYLDGNGAMLTGKQIIGGNVWYFDRDGVWMG